jgi:hypothetical protein
VREEKPMDENPPPPDTPEESRRREVQRIARAANVGCGVGGCLLPLLLVSAWCFVDMLVYEHLTAQNPGLVIEPPYGVLVLAPFLCAVGAIVGTAIGERIGRRRRRTKP